MDERYEAVVGAGSLRSGTGVGFAHRWTEDGVTVDAAFTGAHLLHVATAGCVLNDLYREAAALGITLDGVRVRAYGGFDVASWTSTGVEYAVELDTGAPPADVERLLDRVDDVAEIPRAIRAGAPVRRISS